MLKRFVNSLCTVNNINRLNRRYAGHSKWQNIRHIKGAKDAERSRIFTKLSSQMKVAVHLGGSTDPKKNLKLEQLIEQARRFNMPNASIQNVLKSCEQDKSQSKAHLIEIKGPGSCFLLCEVFTNNLHMTRNTINSILKKHSGKFSDGGAAKHLFDEKGIILIDVEDAAKDKQDALLETATDQAIEAGAEEVEFLDDTTLQFTCAATHLNQVVQKLQTSYKVQSASVEYLAKTYQNLTDSEMETCSKLIEKMNAMPEVVRIFDNVQ